MQIGTTIDLFDELNATNSFHGGEIGLLTSLESGYFIFDIATKLGIGDLERQFTINGSTHVETPAGSPSTTARGLFALPSNMGTSVRNAFALLPELDFKARVLLTERLTANVGYNLMLLSNVYRTGEQIDQLVDTSQLSPFLPANVAAANQPHPRPLLNASTLRAQSLNLGLTFTY